jgi:predicted ATP-dependent protease
MAEKITSRNASKLTTYELRQELNRRDAFDLEESTVNYKTMLARLMKDLVEEEDNEQLVAVNQKAEENKQSVDKAKEIREQRKQEALERSRQRQSDKAYFESKQLANSEVREKKAVSSAAEGDVIEVVNETEPEAAPTTAVNDPFRLIPSSRSKVFVK